MPLLLLPAALCAPKPSNTLNKTARYTFYREELALTVGTQVDPSNYGITVPAGTGQRFLQNCLNACDEVRRRRHCMGLV